MNKSESIDKLAEALAKAQGAMTPAKMDAVNPFLHNKYADLGSVIQAARKPLADNGLSFTQHPTIEDSKVSISTMLMHSSGQWIESVISLPIDNEKGLSLAQSMGKVITYLRRYGLSAILGIYADEDTDGNDNGTQRRNNGNGNKPAPTPAPVPAHSTTDRHAPVTSAVDEHAPVIEPKPGEYVAELYATSKAGWPIDVLAYFVTEYKLKAANQAANMLNLSGFAYDTDLETLKSWVTLYKSLRADGAMTPQEAAKQASAELAQAA